MTNQCHPIVQQSPSLCKHIGSPKPNGINLRFHPVPTAEESVSIPSGNSSYCYISNMASRREILHEVMSETGTTQTLLSRISGIHQPSISQFLSGRVDLSDEQLDRLLSCMGYRLEVVRRSFEPNLSHSERRSWMLHRRLSMLMTEDSFRRWLPQLLTNIKHVRQGVRGQTHLENVERWEELVGSKDLNGLRRIMTGLDEQSIRMREVTPFSGLLPNEDRLEVLRELRRAS